MKKVIVLFVAIFLTGCGTFSFKESTDSLKFKEQYESLNGTKTASGSDYVYVEVPSKNPIKYLTIYEVFDLLDSGTGILYIGRPGCPWCRATFPALFEFAKENKVETIYYYDVETIRNLNNEFYKELLKKLDKYLPVDTVTQSSEDEDFDSSLKRVVLPDVYFIKNGKVTGHYNESRPEYSNVLTEEQLNDVKEKYTNLYNKN